MRESLSLPCMILSCLDHMQDIAKRPDHLIGRQTLSASRRKQISPYREVSIFASQIVKHAITQCCWKQVGEPGSQGCPCESSQW